MSLLDSFMRRLKRPRIDHDALVQLFRLEQEDDVRYMREELNILTDLESVSNLPGGRGGLVRAN
jgi:hypothetical protein